MPYETVLVQIQNKPGLQASEFDQVWVLFVPLFCQCSNKTFPRKLSFLLAFLKSILLLNAESGNRSKKDIKQWFSKWGAGPFKEHGATAEGRSKDKELKTFKYRCCKKKYVFVNIYLSYVLPIPDKIGYDYTYL